MASDGAEQEYVTLVSNDGFEFVVLREATFVSPTIKAMLNPRSGFREATTGRCEFELISGVIMEIIVEYFHYWYKNRDKEDVPDMDIPTEYCLEVLQAGHFLQLW